MINEKGLACRAGKFFHTEICEKAQVGRIVCSSSVTAVPIEEAHIPRIELYAPTFA